MKRPVLALVQWCLAATWAALSAGGCRPKAGDTKAMPEAAPQPTGRPQAQPARPGGTERPSARAGSGLGGLLSARAGRPAPRAARPRPALPGPNEALVEGRVLEKETGRPVAGAAVLYGACGSLRTTTDAQGRYRLLVPWGAVFLLVVHRDHEEAEARFQAERRGRVRRDFRLPRRPSPPKTVRVEGMVEVQVAHPGTRSEYRTALLETADGRKLLLFDISGCSRPLEKYAGRHVRVTGFEGTGRVGWMHRPTKGLIVEQLTVLP